MHATTHCSASARGRSTIPLPHHYHLHHCTPPTAFRALSKPRADVAWMLLRSRLRSRTKAVGSVESEAMLTETVAALKTQAVLNKVVATLEVEATLTENVAILEHVETLDTMRSDGHLRAGESNDATIALSDGADFERIEHKDQVPTTKGDTLAHAGGRDKVAKPAPTCFASPSRAAQPALRTASLILAAWSQHDPRCGHRHGRMWAAGSWDMLYLHLGGCVELGYATSSRGLGLA